MELPKIPLGNWVEMLVDTATKHLAPLFDVIVLVIKAVIGSFQDLLLLIPPLLLIVIFSALILWLTKPRIALGTALGLLLIYNLELWAPAVNTISLVLWATISALIFGIPLGIWTARNDTVHKIVMPVLDFMQTMPPFVYLVPAVFFFSVGIVPGMLATLVFAMPPTIRLTGLGIRQVPRELVEAAEAFGSTPRQKLFKVQIPLALPTIMAGINQCIMLSLSMVVIAALIGAGGLGSVVVTALGRLDVGMGFEGGLAIVIIAIILDRVTQNISEKRKKTQQNAQ